MEVGCFLNLPSLPLSSRPRTPRGSFLHEVRGTFVTAPTAGLDPEAGFVIPENFALVWPGVYRSSFPKEETFGFVKCLKLKSILTLFPEEYPAVNSQFMKEAGIEHFQIGMPGNKEPFVNIPKDRVAAALEVVLDRRNHPVLIHCNKGKHRTGCVIGCLRKIQKWGLTLIFDEYRRHSHPKSRALDQQFIELFDPTVVMNIAQENDWIPKYSP
ncbi:tyrosine phosphatase family-domain-containing protein [Peziza echinospora]|nr:tyrosine phosphatase family-domain-containing protein [Peziza echinospora]